LRGHAKNLSDGRVEVIASGTDAALDALEQWLWRGPSGARVDDVLREYCEAPVDDHFHTR